jgi:hypothetical protein
VLAGLETGCEKRYDARVYRNPRGCVFVIAASEHLLAVVVGQVARREIDSDRARAILHECGQLGRTAPAGYAARVDELLAEAEAAAAA